MNDILVKIGADITDFSRKMKESNDALKNFGKANSETFDAFKKTGAVVTAAGTGLALGLGSAVKTATDFESGMSQVAAISGSVGDDLAALEARARELGGSTSFSAKEAADGLQYLALAGWDTTQMIDGLEPILHLAEAGALELGRSADLVTDSMAGLGLEVDDLDGYLDKVAKTAASSNTDIDALMEAFVVAGGTFDRFNVPLEEANAFLGVMANRGFKGSEAGTAMNAIMARLTQTTGPAANALEEMGLSAFDSEGNFRGMETVLKEVEASLADMTDQERAHYTQQLAGLNHGKSFAAMLSGLGNEYDELKGDIVDSNGALIEMRNTMKDNLQGALENLNSAFEEAQIALGQALLPAIKKVTEWLQKLLDWFNGLSEKTKSTIAIIAALSSVFMLIIGPLLMLIGFIPQIIAGFAVVKTVVMAVAGAIGFLISPVGLIIAAIAAVIAILVLMYNKLEWFRDMVHEAWDAIVKAFNVALDFIKEIVDQVITAVVDFVGEQLDKLKAFWDENGADIMEIVKRAFESVRDIIKTVMGVIKGVFEAVWPIITNVVQTAWTLIKGIIDVAINLVLGIIQTVLKLLKGDWEGAWNTIKDTAKSIMDSIVNTFKNIDLLQIGKDIINGLIKGIKSMAGAVKDGVMSLANKLPGWVKKPLGIKSPSRVFMALGRFTGEGLAVGIDDMTGAVKKATTNIVDAATPDKKAIDLSYATPSGIKSTLASAVNGTVDVNSRDENIASAIDYLSDKLDGLKIEMNGREFGRAVSDVTASEYNGAVRGGGRRRI